MASDKSKQYEEELLEVIKAKKIAFLDHCFAFTSFCGATAYNHGLEKLETIKSAIKENRVKAKNYMLNKWVDSDNPTLQLAAYRLLSEPEEHRLLNQTYVDQKSTVETITTPVINIVTGSAPPQARDDNE